jgi:hypothetical protein
MKPIVANFLFRTWEFVRSLFFVWTISTMVGIIVIWLYKYRSGWDVQITERTMHFLENWFGNHPFLAATIPLFFALLLFNILPWVWDQLKKQFKTRHNSWVLTILFALFFLPLNINLLKILFRLVDRQIFLTMPGYLSLGFFVFGLIAYKIGTFIYKADYFLKNANFAPGSVGCGDDLLDMEKSAQNAALQIEKITESVSVVAIYGGMGAGKSSYTRMIVESMTPNNTLYTYISLTETNTEDDFSKLFAERWIETIKERYPKIDISAQSFQPLLRDLLRETGGVWSDLVSLVPQLNITKTQLRAQEGSRKQHGRFVDRQTASYFANIPSFNEDIWVIVIDEIERAKFSEIYRVIELIERMKHVGRAGMPIKLIFILNIAREDLQQRVKISPDHALSEHSDLAVLINDFLFTNPKNITLTLFVPPVQRSKWIGFISEKIKAVYDEFGFAKAESKRALQPGHSLEESLPELRPLLTTASISLVNPVENFPNVHAHAYVIFFQRFLMNESPRSIYRIVAEFRSLMNGFRDINGNINNYSIRFTDILIVAYLHVLYPAIIDYFERTIGARVPEENETTPEAQTAYLMQREEELEIAFSRNIDKQVVGSNSTVEDALHKSFLRVVKAEVDKNLLLDLVALVAHDYIDAAKNAITERSNRHSDPTKLEYETTTSRPENLLHLLRGFAGPPSRLEANYTHYRHTQKAVTYLDGIDDVGDLLSYSDFYRNEEKNSLPAQHLALAANILRLLQNGSINPDILSNDEKSKYDKATYELLFNLMEAGIRNPDAEEINRAVDILCETLLDKRLNTQIKYQFINSFMHVRNNGEVHFRLKQAFDEFIQKPLNAKKIRTAVERVVTDTDNKYFSEKSTAVVYENEEAPIFVLYQSWSGLLEDVDGIKRLRSAAQRGLKKYPRALEGYWQSYPYESGWKSWKDFQNSHRLENNAELLIPLKELIELTEVVDVSEFIKQKAAFYKENLPSDWQGKINPDNETIYAVIKNHRIMSQDNK